METQTKFTDNRFEQLGKASVADDNFCLTIGDRVL